MSDLIERQAAISLAGDLQIHGDEYHMYNQAINNYCTEIMGLPPAQPDLPIKEKCAYCPHCRNCDVNDDLSIAQPKIILCKDCKHWINHHLCESLSRYGTFETKEEFFCGYAERKSNE